MYCVPLFFLNLRALRIKNSPKFSNSHRDYSPDCSQSSTHPKPILGAIAPVDPQQQPQQKRTRFITNRDPGRTSILAIPMTLCLSQSRSPIYTGRHCTELNQAIALCSLSLVSLNT